MITERPFAAGARLDEHEIAIRPVEPDDASLLTVWRSEASVRRHQPLGPISARQLRAEIAARRHYDLGQGRGERFDWIVEYHRRPVGWLTLVIHSWTHGLGECGYAVSTPYQRHGIMPVALSHLLDEIFARTDLHRLEARCAVENVPSQKVLEKLGFVREGLLRGYFLLEQGRVDNYLYALLRDDWDAEGRP